MSASTRRVDLQGPAGRIDVAIDSPDGAPVGIALIAHPHPLYGGTRDNKVVQTLARAFLGLGMRCWRPNFRGVGGSEGGHDEGRGETDDLIRVAEAARALARDDGLPDAPLVLAGFSFGSFVQTRVAQALREAGRPASRLVLVAPAVSRFALAPVPPGTLVIQGDEDDLVPLPSVLAWARQAETPVVVLPGADHFFHRKLTQLKAIVLAGFGQVAATRAGDEDV